MQAQVSAKTENTDKHADTHTHTDRDTETTDPTGIGSRLGLQDGLESRKVGKFLCLFMIDSSKLGMEKLAS